MAKSIVVRSGQHVELTEKSTTALGGILVDLRPKTANALRTLLAQVGKNPARFQDGESFEQLKSRENYVELLPDKDGSIQGLSAPGLIAMVRALPAGAKMPKTVEVPVFKRISGGRRSAKARSSRDFPVSLAPQLATVDIPEWLQNLRVFRTVLLFEDIVVESGGLLTIDYPTITARNFVLHAGGRVKQLVSLAMELTGSFRIVA